MVNAKPDMTSLRSSASLPDGVNRKGFLSRPILAKPDLYRFGEIFERVQLMNIADRPWDISDDNVIEEAFFFTIRNRIGRGNLNKVASDSFAQAFQLNKTGTDLVSYVLDNRPDVQEAFQTPISVAGFWRPEDAVNEDFGALSAFVTSLVTPDVPRRISVKIAMVCLDALRRPDSVNWADIFFQAFQREASRMKGAEVKNPSYLAPWLYNLWQFNGSLTKSEQDVYEKAQITRILRKSKEPTTAPEYKKSMQPDGNILPDTSPNKRGSSPSSMNTKKMDAESSTFSAPTSEVSSAQNEQEDLELRLTSMNGPHVIPAGKAMPDNTQAELEDAKALTDEAMQEMTLLAESTLREFSRLVSGQKNSHEQDVNMYMIEVGSAEEQAKKLETELIWTRLQISNLDSKRKKNDVTIVDLQGQNRKLEKEVLYLKTLLPHSQEIQDWKEIRRKVTELEEEAKRREDELCAFQGAEAAMNARIRNLEKLCGQLKTQIFHATSEKISGCLSEDDYRELVACLEKFPGHWEMRSEDKVTLDAYMAAYPLGPQVAGQKFHHSKLGGVLDEYKCRARDTEQYIQELLDELKILVQALEPWYTACKIKSNFTHKWARTSSARDESPSAESSRASKRLRTTEKVDNANDARVKQEEGGKYCNFT